jgi:hypothetical protein
MEVKREIKFEKKRNEKEKLDKIRQDKRNERK